ncbi:hypothetical protein HELRODRAFT_187296 [Helobdella robusta]|uniref:Glyoxylate reductase/hydroxypyruvate reductase n=1 Tax=Helobdella robusta TaxID=6412 RepID=T1FP85_HELRO|nr:hypothetical protein HELRODRAFT_187296 [Helobdella robusta]ESN98310.1 hypothetical protein HELRODRAFT_187296 [Helobdella robusta]
MSSLSSSSSSPTSSSPDSPLINLSNSMVYITRKVPSSGINHLIKAGVKVKQWDSEEVIPRDVLLEQVKGVDALFCLLTEKIDEEVIEAAGPKLSVVSTMSVGYEHISLDICRKKNIKVGFTPDILTPATTELTMALLLAVSRRIVEGFNAIKAGEWQTWKPEWMLGRGLQNSTVGIVGYGRIGQAVAACLWPLGVSRILYSTRQGMAEYVSFDELLELSDFVICACSLNNTTREIFNRDAFSKMKKTSIFVNISRGGVVQQNDLYWALKNKVIWGAGLDVTIPEPLPPFHPLLTLPNIVISPHIGSATVETRSDMCMFTAKNIICGLLNKPMPGRIV